MAKCSTCPMGLKSASTVTWRYPIDPECDHEWLTYGIGPTLCRKCGAVLPEAGAPRER
jgi:hypothetical protein